MKMKKQHTDNFMASKKQDNKAPNQSDFQVDKRQKRLGKPAPTEEETATRSKLVVESIARLYKKAAKEEKELRDQIRKSLLLRPLIESEVGKLTGLPEERMAKLVDRISELVLRLEENEAYEKENSAKYVKEYDEEDIRQAEQLVQEFFEKRTLAPGKRIHSKTIWNKPSNSNGDEILYVVGRSMLCAELQKKEEEIIKWSVQEAQDVVANASEEKTLWESFLRKFAPMLVPNDLTKDRDYEMITELEDALRNINNPKGQMYPLIRSIEMVLNDIVDAMTGIKIARHYSY